MKRPIWCRAFLIALADPSHVGNIRECAELVGRSRPTIYLRRKADPSFAREMDAALAECERALAVLCAPRRIA